MVLVEAILEGVVLGLVAFVLLAFVVFITGAPLSMLTSPFVGAIVIGVVSLAAHSCKAQDAGVPAVLGGLVIEASAVPATLAEPATDLVADAAVEPFKLRCPDLNRCGTEDGTWIPNWYGRELLLDREKLRTVVKELAIEAEARQKLEEIRQELESQLHSLEIELTEIEGSQELLDQSLSRSRIEKTRRMRAVIALSGVGLVLFTVVVATLSH